MVKKIITNRLAIAIARKGNLLRFSLLPNESEETKGKISGVTVISYDADTVESDVDILEIIGILKGEPTWRHLYMNGVELEDSTPTDYFEFYIPDCVYPAPHGVILDEFTVNYNDLLIPGLVEQRFVEASLKSAGIVNMKALMRLEALKYARQYFSNIEEAV